MAPQQPARRLGWAGLSPLQILGHQQPGKTSLLKVLEVRVSPGGRHRSR